MKRLSYRTLSLVTTLIFAWSARAVLADPSTATEATTSNESKNIARMNCGARLECITPNGHYAPVSLQSSGNPNAAVLIMDDDTVSCPLAEGDTTFIISLPRTAMLDRFSFVNENAAAQGNLRIAVSNYKLPPGSAKWTEVEGHVPFSHKRLFNLSMLGVEAKYVKLTFHVESQGRIAALALYGERSIEDFARKESHVIRANNSLAVARGTDALNFDYANSYARARVVYVSSGNANLASRMIDDDTDTSFAFATNDPHPTVVIELAEAQRLHRVSAMYKMARSHVEVFLLNELPQNPDDLNGLKPVAAVDDVSAIGAAAVNFNPRGARYVALRWSGIGAAVEGKDYALDAAGGKEAPPVMDDAGAAPRGLEVAEISAFGDVPLSFLYSAAEAPDFFASNNPAIYPGEGNPDFSNTLGTLASPPVITPVSP